MYNPPHLSRPVLTIEHRNPKGTGTELRLSLHPATKTEQGYIMAEIAEENGKYFDLVNGLACKWDFAACGAIVSVLSGWNESTEPNDVFNKTENGQYVCTSVSHEIEPTTRYCIKIHEKPDGKSLAIYLSPKEALALRSAIDGAMSRIAFGD